MKPFCLLILSVFFSIDSFSQKINLSNLKLLRKTEDSLKLLSAQIMGGITSADRLKADSSFTKMFVRALKINNSFYYPFDSLISISKLSPPDSSFKIFTWQLIVNDNVTRQHGAIQTKTNDGSLNLLPLIDKSDVIANVADTIGNNYNWIGAIYYQVIEKQVDGKTCYTLLGYDENSIRSNKKIIEVLTFKNGRPVFGGPYFNFNGNIAGSRFVLEYKKNASPRLTYDKDMDMIIYEHLISETGEPQKKFTYIPDGDYEGLQWKNGKWHHIEKIFTQQLKEGEAPVPNPIRDEKGNIDNSKLMNGSVEIAEQADLPAIIEKPALQKAKAGKKNTKNK
jgi:hypothetical protein